MRDHDEPDLSAGIREYDAFASHAVDPDSDLVRRVKREIEAIHERPSVQERYREMTGRDFDPIRICVDGTDFVFPKTDPDTEPPIDALVKSYLLRSRSLLVFSGTETIGHPWIDREIEWFRELCPDKPIHFALTHAPDPGRSDSFVPPAVADIEIGLFSDLRGYYHRALAGLSSRIRKVRSERMTRALLDLRAWKSVRSFDEELARLAARLLSNRGHGDFAVEDLERGFETELRRTRRLRRVGYALVVVVVLALAGVLLKSLFALSEEQRLRTNRIWTSQADILRGGLDASLLDSLALSANAIANGDREDGPRGLVQTLQRLVKSDRLYQRQGDSGTFAPGKRRAHIETLAEIPGGDEVLLGGIDGHLVLFDVTARKELTEVYLANTRIQDIVVLPGSQEFAVGTRSGLFFIRLNREESGPILELVARSVSEVGIFSIAYDPVWDRVVGGRRDGRVVAFDRPVPGEPWSGTKLYTLIDADFATRFGATDVQSIVFDLELRRMHDGTSRAYLASLNRFIAAIDLDEESATEVWLHLFDEDREVTAIDVDTDGEVLLATDLDGRIFHIDGETGALVAEVPTFLVEASSLAIDAKGAYRFAHPDVLGNVALDLHPSGLFFGVGSHDRTIKFFDVAGQSGSGLSVVVHNEGARDIRFSEDGLSGYSVSDDGTLQKFRLLDTYEDLRLSGVDRGYPLLDGAGTLILKREDGGPTLWSRVRGLRSVPDLSTVSARWLVLPGKIANIVVFGETPRLLTLSADGVAPVCEDRALIDLLGLSEVETLHDAYPVGEDGLVLFSTINPDGGTLRLVVLDPRACDVTRLSEDSYPKKANITTAKDFVSVQAAPNAVITWRRIGDAFGASELITSELEIKNLAFGPSGLPFVAVEVSDQPSADQLCLCVKAPSFPVSILEAGPSCGIQRTGASCAAVDIPVGWTAGGFRSGHAAPSGRYFVFGRADARLGLLEVPTRPWRRPLVRSIAPRQSRPINAPFAFTGKEDALAVPNGDTGVRVLDPSDLSILSILPTPGRVYALGFDGDLLVSTDGANEDAILRAQPWRPEEILHRACDYWPVGGQTAVPAGVPAIQPRSAFCTHVP